MMRAGAFMKKCLYILSLAGAALVFVPGDALAGCNVPGVAVVELSGPVSVCEGGTLTLTVTYTSGSGNNITLKIDDANKAVFAGTSSDTITVNGSGGVAINALSAGNVVVTVQSGIPDNPGDCKHEFSVIRAEIYPTIFSVCGGSSRDLTVTITPSAASGEVFISTDDANIATVSGSPPSVSVTGVGEGTTVLRAEVAGATCESVSIIVEEEVEVVLACKAVQLQPEEGEEVGLGLYSVRGGVEVSAVLCGDTDLTVTLNMQLLIDGSPLHTEGDYFDLTTTSRGSWFKVRHSTVQTAGLTLQQRKSQLPFRCHRIRQL